MTVHAGPPADSLTPTERAEVDAELVTLFEDLGHRGGRHIIDQDRWREYQERILGEIRRLQRLQALPVVEA